MKFYFLSSEPYSLLYYYSIHFFKQLKTNILLLYDNILNTFFYTDFVKNKYLIKDALVANILFLCKYVCINININVHDEY